MIAADVIAYRLNVPMIHMDMWGTETKCIVVRKQPDFAIPGLKTVEGYCISLMEQYSTNMAGTRIPLFVHDEFEDIA